MLVEIGSITSLDVGQQIYDKLAFMEEVEMMFLEKGRSDASFVKRQFGEFGEAAVITIIADENKQDIITNHISEVADLTNSESGIIMISKKIINKKEL